MAMTSQQYLNVPSSRLRTYYTIEHRHFVEGLLRVNVSHLGLLYASLNLKKKHDVWFMLILATIFINYCRVTTDDVKSCPILEI